MNPVVDIKTCRARGGAFFQKGLHCAAEEQWLLWLQLAEELKDASEKAKALNGLGVLFYARHDFDRALSYYDQAAAALSSGIDDATMARVQSNLGFAHWYIGDFGRARIALGHSARLFGLQGNAILGARVGLGLGLLHLRTGDLKSADEATSRALAVFREADDTPYEGRAYLNLGAILTENKEFDRALSCFERALEVHIQNEDYQLIAYTYTEIARLYSRQGNINGAMDYCNRSLTTILRDLTEVDRMELARLSHLFGEIFLLLGDPDRAIGYLDRAHDYYTILHAGYDQNTVTRDLVEARAQARIPGEQAAAGVISLEEGPFKEQELRLQYLNTFLCFTDALEAKDPYTRGHSERVTAYALKMATYMGLSRREKEILGCAGRLHDVGKMTVSDAVLNKPGKLTDGEYAAIQKHPKAGADMTKFILTSHEAMSLVRHHHERFDGKGYPDGLKGKEIPLLTRTLSVADVYDALTSDRPYRSAFRHSTTMAILKENAGTQLDPDLVAVFEGCHKLEI